MGLTTPSISCFVRHTRDGMEPSLKDSSRTSLDRSTSQETLQLAEELGAKGDAPAQLAALERGLLELSMSHAQATDQATPRFRYAQMLLAKGVSTPAYFLVFQLF